MLLQTQTGAETDAEGSGDGRRRERRWTHTGAETDAEGSGDGRSGSKNTSWICEFSFFYYSDTTNTFGVIEYC